MFKKNSNINFMPKGRPKKELVVGATEPVVTVKETPTAPATGEEKKVFYEFEERGKKYRKSFDEKGNSLGVVEL